MRVIDACVARGVRASHMNELKLEGRTFQLVTIYPCPGFVVQVVLI